MNTFKKGLKTLGRALNDETRINILYYLIQNGDTNVQTLVEHTQKSQTSISHHLRILTDSGLAKIQKQGRNHYYSISDKHVETILQILKDHFSE
ncbi:ArsR/SmtB family transcription factor [Apilactobacillus ozensis]|uniref:HTH arsR-type domain-containing protein n=1 Tax=Apilactobacillus ozensis DSM 23829 = JCM 17196 TaxID=1423781 RepID=A0A0R2ASX8_9LACO|nr:metalloregulator ArsR/SmtB family transcription factor [Apilactobacillus ozensis]KRM69690.1 hypothetical protein FD06_GL000863 [Apilactobacillus ozensis DSM 23829 = JCM 17196]MCK8607040.1 metalloregulator ArsR/SmtB family transcription factor [Apilactobacillus ozensis]